jgi:hypothetical protein
MLSRLFGIDPQKRFWKWFQDNASSLAAVRSGEDPILEKLDRELRKVHPNLNFEMGLSDNNQLEFIVSANGIKKVFPVVEQLVACAPTLPNWKIIAFRQPKGKAAVSEVRYENFFLRAEDVWFSYKQRMDQMVDLTIYIRDLSPSNTNQAIGASLIHLDNELGEYLATTGIGFFDFQPLPDNPAARGFQPLSEISTIVVKR